MRIAILELYCGASGTLGYYNSQEIGLAKAYAKLGHDVLILYPQKSLNKRELRKIDENITVIYVPSVVFGVHAFYDLKILKEYKIQLVHLDSDNQAYAPYVMSYCRKHRISLYNYVGTVYTDSDSRWKKRIMFFFSKRNIECFRRYKTYAKTKYVQCQLLDQGVAEVEVVPVGLDMESIPEIKESKTQLREYLKLPVEKKIIIFVGRLEAYKRPLEAIRLLKMLDESYHMVLIGKGSMQQEVLTLITQLQLKNRVSYIERIPNIEIHQYYKTADCLVNFNEKEIYGMSILEAMYQGCPAVVMNAPGPASIVENDRTGFLCENLEEMAIKVTNIHEGMRYAASESIKNNFCWEQSAEKFLSGVGYK